MKFLPCTYVYIMFTSCLSINYEHPFPSPTVSSRVWSWRWSCPSSWWSWCWPSKRWRFLPETKFIYLFLYLPYPSIYIHLFYCLFIYFLSLYLLYIFLFKYLYISLYIHLDYLIYLSIFVSFFVFPSTSSPVTQPYRCSQPRWWSAWGSTWPYANHCAGNFELNAQAWKVSW